VGKEELRGAVTGSGVKSGQVEGFLSQVSYRGRVLIINNLVASSLWHKLAVLNPPAPLADLQRKLLLVGPSLAEGSSVVHDRS
jgi:hypothetical protein